MTSTGATTNAMIDMPLRPRIASCEVSDTAGHAGGWPLAHSGSLGGHDRSDAPISDQHIMRAAPTGLALLQHLLLHQVRDVARGGVLRGLRELGVLAGGEVATYSPQILRRIRALISASPLQDVARAQLHPMKGAGEHVIKDELDPEVIRCWIGILPRLSRPPSRSV